MRPRLADRYKRSSKREALLQKWLEPHRLPAGSRDPLGFQSSAERLANETLPGLTVFTTRIAYYSFIAWAVRELNGRRWPSSTVLRELFHKVERAYVLCEFVHHGSEANDRRVIGQRSKSEVLQPAVNDCFRPPARILKKPGVGRFASPLHDIDGKHGLRRTETGTSRRRSPASPAYGAWQTPC